MVLRQTKRLLGQDQESRNRSTPICTSDFDKQEKAIHWRKDSLFLKNGSKTIGYPYPKRKKKKKREEL